GEIPDQTVWSGSSRAFLVHSTQNPQGILTLNTAPEPQGTLAFQQQEEEEQWLFRYVPSSDDLQPFQVTISGPGETQTFTVTPQPSLPPETTVFATGEHTGPVLISSSEASVYESLSPLPEPLNYQNEIVRHIRIVGDHVEVEA